MCNDDIESIRKVVRDEVNAEVTRGQSADRWTNRITAVFAGLAVCIGAYFGATINNRQEVQVEKADARDQKIDKLEMSNEVMLNANYVYLAGQVEKAIDEGLPTAEIKMRQQRAKEAKRVYDDFVANKGKP